MSFCPSVATLDQTMFGTIQLVAEGPAHWVHLGGRQKLCQKASVVMAVLFFFFASDVTLDWNAQ